MRATDLPEDLYGAHLEGVHELLFDPAEATGPPMCEAVRLDLGPHSIIVQTLTAEREAAADGQRSLRLTW